MKRSLLINFNNGEKSEELEIGKAVSVNSEKEFIYFEKMNDGKWRLTFTDTPTAKAAGFFNPISSHLSPSLSGTTMRHL